LGSGSESIALLSSLRRAGVKINLGWGGYATDSAEKLIENNKQYKGKYILGTKLSLDEQADFPFGLSKGPKKKEKKEKF